MKLLLTAINAKYIHSSLAIRSLKQYAACYGEQIAIQEFTINQNPDYILEQLYRQKADVIGFSCYIWNREMILQLAENLKKVSPRTVIFLGGPEVSYDAAEMLSRYPYLDLIVRGEGEATFLDLARHWIDGAPALADIPGITWRAPGPSIVENAARPPLNLQDIPFVYDDLSSFVYRIIYYETQRGCPYQCQYCLSSVENGVRFLPEERVKKDLDFFLSKKVMQVKFVDRTFNCNRRHARMIWQYLIEHDNRVTNFHMEITADLMDDDTIDLLKKARKGLFQFEIGVQTTNPQTMKAIRRTVSFEKLSQVVRKLKALGNIHLHLDLIAGLPLEDYDSFGRSFDDVYRLEPDQLQLGFLKLLKGSGLRRDAEQYGICYRSQPPYEVLSTACLSFDDLCRLKLLEEMVETFYNSPKALRAIRFITTVLPSPFAFFQQLGLFWEEKGYRAVNHNRAEYSRLFYEFCTTQQSLTPFLDIIADLLRFDLCLGDNAKRLPQSLQWDTPDIREARSRFYHDRKQIESLLPYLAGYTPAQLARMCPIELFRYDVSSLRPGQHRPAPGLTAVLFDYTWRDPMTNEASWQVIPLL